MTVAAPASTAAAHPGKPRPPDCAADTRTLTAFSALQPGLLDRVEEAAKEGRATRPCLCLIRHLLVHARAGMDVCATPPETRGLQRASGGSGGSAVAPPPQQLLQLADRTPHRFQTFRVVVLLCPADLSSMRAAPMLAAQTFAGNQLIRGGLGPPAGWHSEQRRCPVRPGGRSERGGHQRRRRRHGGERPLPAGRQLHRSGCMTPTCAARLSIGPPPVAGALARPCGPGNARPRLPRLWRAAVAGRQQRRAGGGGTRVFARGGAPRPGPDAAPSGGRVGGAARLGGGAPCEAAGPALADEPAAC